MGRQAEEGWQLTTALALASDLRQVSVLVKGHIERNWKDTDLLSLVTASWSWALTKNLLSHQDPFQTEGNCGPNRPGSTVFFIFVLVTHRRVPASD